MSLLNLFQYLKFLIAWKTTYCCLHRIKILKLCLNWNHCVMFMKLLLLIFYHYCARFNLNLSFKLGYMLMWFVSTSQGTEFTCIWKADTTFIIPKMCKDIKNADSLLLQGLVLSTDIHHIHHMVFISSISLNFVNV